jgi:hypothetical protein
MSVTRGCLGKIFGKALLATGATVLVDEVSAWSYEESAEQIDASKIGDCTKKFEAGAQQTTGQVTAHWEPAATGNQDIFVVGDKVTLELYPGGNSSGSVFYQTPTGGATITSVARAGGVEGLVGNDFGFSVNGAMTTTAVP